MVKKSQQTKTSISQIFLNMTFKDVLFYLVALFVFLFFLIAPFYKGLFNGGIRGVALDAYVFNQPMYTSMIYTFLFGIVFGLYLVVRKDHINLESSNHVLIVLLFGIPFSYVLSYITAVSQIQNTHSLFIHMMYVIFFLIAYYIARSDKFSSFVPGTLLLTGYVIVIFGFMNWFGDASLWGMINYSSNPEQFRPTYIQAVNLEPAGLRLTSIFQYANTYAALLIGLLLASLYLTVHASNRWIVGVSAFMTVPIIVSFFLTLSRGALVILPIVLLVVLLLIRFSRQVTYLIYLAIASVISLLLLAPITSIGESQFEAFNPSDNLTGWAILIGASAVFTALAMLFHRFLQPGLNKGLVRITNAKWSNAYLPFIAVLVGGIGAYLLFGNTGFVQALPDTVRERIESINFEQHSVLERLTFYNDSLKVIADYPIFGAGGGGWSLLYEQYQNNPYSSTQAHSFYAQYFIETGAVGFLILIAFLAYIYWHYLRSYFRSKSEDATPGMVLFILSAAMLIHSALDFNMSYLYIGCLVFVCLGGLSAHSDYSPRHSFLKGRKQVRKYILPGLLIIMSLILTIFSSRMLTASHHYVQALKNLETGNFYEVAEPLESAIRLFPHTDYLGFRSKIYLDVFRQDQNPEFEQELLSSVARLKQLEPVNTVGLESELQLYLEKEEYLKAVEVLEKMRSRMPWNINVYNVLIPLYTQLATEELDRRDLDGAYTQKALEYYDQLTERIAYLDTLPEGQLQGRTFEVTPEIARSISQIYLYHGRYEDVSHLLQPIVNNLGVTDESVPLIRNYLVALMKQDQLDEALYDEFIAAFPEEEVMIHGVINLLDEA